MGAKSNALENALIDFWLRGQSLVPPATTYIKLIVCNGVHAVGTPLTLNDLIAVQDDSNKWRLYMVTTAGTTAGVKPSYPGVNNEVIADGSAVLTQQNAGLESGASISTPVGNGYANAAVVSNMANWAGTHGADTTTVSTGVGATTSNNAPVAFPNPTGDWGWVFGFLIDDTDVSLGRYLWSEFQGGPVQIVSAATNVQFNNGQLSYQEDN